MPTSLAQQLAQNASLNTSLLVDRTRRKPTQSYLFAAREADQHDLDSIHALGVNGFLQLSALDSSLQAYEGRLLSDTAKATDRTLQPKSVNAELDAAIEGFLALIGPFVMEVPTGKVIEWLVRRFRINEFNVQAVLRLFLPYHESPHFIKMLSILHISETSPFAALLPYQSTATTLTRAALVNLMLQPTNADLARFVAGLLPSAVQTEALGGVHRTLLAFHTGVLFDFVKRRQDGRTGKTMDEGTAAWFLPAAMKPMQMCATIQVEPAKERLAKEVILSSFLLLSALSHTSPLSSGALSVILKAIASCADRVASQHVIRSLVAVCAAQEDVSSDTVSKTVVKAIMKLDTAEENLKEAVTYVGSENFISGLLAGLVSRLEEERAFNIILCLLPLPNLPSEMVSSLTTDLITHLIHGNTQDDTTHETVQIMDGRSRALLVQIQQRYPRVLQKGFDTAMAGENANKEALEQSLLSLSLDLPPTAEASQEQDMVIASANADATVRVIAVRHLYAKLGADGLSNEEAAAIRSALLTRVQDTNSSVLEALYAESTALLSIIMANLNDYIQTLARTLQSASKNILKLHLNSVASHLYPAISASADHPDLLRKIFHDLFFPFLLFSKPRQKAATAVWEILETTEKTGDSEAGMGRYELLGGCVDAVRWQEASVSEKRKEDGPRSVDQYIKINDAVAGKIAENIVVSNAFKEHMEAFLPKLQSDNVHVRTLGHLVLRAILGRLSGERQIDAAFQVIQAMGINSLTDVGELFSGVDNVAAYLEDTNIGHAIFSKPSSQNTLHRLQSSILVMLPTLSRPSGVALNWVDASNLDSNTGSQYVPLLRAVYGLVNSSSNAPSLSTHLMRLLFITLGDDALSFLAGIWLQRFTESDSAVLTYVALYHGAAFLEAHHATQNVIDFQTILPAILVVLQHADRRVREAALQCIAALSRLSQAKKPTAVYAYDAIYGESSSTLLYLDWPDFTKYIQALNKSGDHFLNDATYLRIFNQTSLNTSRADSKKEAGYKRRILSCFISHINACRLMVVKVSLLQSIEEVSSPVKMQLLLPTTGGLSKPENVTLADPSLHEQFATLLVSSIDSSSLNDLNDPQGASWAVYKATVHRFFGPESQPLPRQAISRRLRSSVFSGLKLERKVEVCRWFLQFGQENAEVANECKLVLADIIGEVAIIVQLLSVLQPKSDDTTQRANKRTKIDSSAAGPVDDALSSLSILAEILGSKPLPGSLELVTSLLDTLTKVVHDAPSITRDKVFLEQLLMSALENVALNMPEGFSMPSTVRLDVLVEMIRVSENPQTFNQALLLMATLARLAPNAILHNIMPIFTFMGSNVFHRDDSYSFRVVQKTIDSIVPVMATSLRDNHPDRLDMFIAARPFLRLFTDAANHIPRHRRTSFFTQLVDALGADDFLAPICMLLVDKVSNRVARQNASDAQSSLFLPLSVLERYPSEMRLQTLVELLHEAHQLVNADLKPSEPAKRFLEVPIDDESTSNVSVIKRQALSVIAYIGLALQGASIAPSDTEVSGTFYSSKIISLLLDLAVPKGSKVSLDGVAKMARSAIENALRAMSAKDFVQGVLVVVQSGVSVQHGALDLLGDQLVNITGETRAEIWRTIVKIVEHTRKLLTSEPEAPVVIASFHAVNAITATMCSGEESVLTSVVPVAINYVKDGKSVSSALAALDSLTGKLGPRVIPYFKDIVGTCVSVLQNEEVVGSSDDEAPSETALNILQTLLSSIPKFWSNAELLQVINLYLDNGSSYMSTFMKMISKKAQSKILLPLLCDVWSSLSSSRNETTATRMVRYFGFLKRCIRSAARENVAANIRLLFKTFLEAFQVCATAPSLMTNIKDDTISAFLELVVKLNEAAFRPLFRKMFDWAFASEATGEKRSLVFSYVYSALLDHFKGLMTAYMSFLLQPFLTILSEFKDESYDDEELWLAVVSTLTKSVVHDEGAFWRDDKFKQSAPLLVAQIPVATRLNSEDAKIAMSDCLLALTEVAQNDIILKTINLDILMHTRSEDARIRVFALTCSEALWRSHGGKLIGFVSETATFIAEAAEDPNDTVVKEAHRLKNAVENLTGSIDV